MGEHGQDEHDHTFEWNDIYTGSASDYEAPDPWFVERAAELPSARALDVGCGAGGLVCALAERGWKVTGVDIAPNAIDAATAALEERGLKASLEVADATGWRPSSQYELVTNSFALPTSAEERAPVLAAIRDALVPGGVVLLKEHDTSMQRLPHFAAYDLPSLDELRAAFEGFELVQAEVEEYEADPRYRSNPEVAERWHAVVVHARKPTADEGGAGR